MITQDQLTAAGYRKFTTTKEYADCMYQKGITDDFGKCYYINVTVYDNTEIITRGYQGDRYSFEADAQLTLADGSVFNVQLLNPNSIDHLEKFFAEIWSAMGCCYYEMFEED